MDPTRRVEPGDTGTDLGVVVPGSWSPSEVREDRQATTTGDRFRPVMCPGCDAVVSLLDSECWLCFRYFSANEFDDQR
jgi:hypothetical protein